MLREVGEDPSDDKVKEFVLDTLKGGVSVLYEKLWLHFDCSVFNYLYIRYNEGGGRDNSNMACFGRKT